MTRAIVDLCGRKFGKLTVTGYAGRDKHGKRRWICVCDCNGDNSTKSIEQGKLLRKENPTRSCGCLVKKHGHSSKGKRSSTYSTWCSMIERCYSENNPSYKYYGARGIIVCDRWNPREGGSFENFLLDMGERPKGKTIDRIDCNKNYEPSNCRWQTSQEQNSNKNNNVLVECNGKKQSISQWARESGIPYGTLRWRIVEQGWNPEIAVSTPVEQKHKRKEVAGLISVNGEEKTCLEWAQEYGLSTATIYYRLRKGWTTEDAVKTPLLR